MTLASILTRLAGFLLLVPPDMTRTPLGHTLDPTPTDETDHPLAAPDKYPAGWGGGVLCHDIVERDGIALREVTFGLRVPPADAANVTMVHVNTIMDRRRDNVSYALLQAVDDESAGAELRVRSFLLPDDGTWSYRFVSHPDLTVDMGKTREGWRKVQGWGQPDASNADVIPNPLGGQSSVFTGATTRTHADWTTAPAANNQTTTTLDLEHDGEVTLHHGPTAAPRLLVMFDGDFWRPMKPQDALAYRDYDIVLVDSGANRQRTLTDLDYTTDLVASAIRAAESILNTRFTPDRVVVAGQSFGGLAAAALALRTNLAHTGIAQSGSYWFSSTRPPKGPEIPERVDGDLMEWLVQQEIVDARLIVQVGSDEMDMTRGSRRFSEVATAKGAQVSHDEWRGGHDYAWWRHGLSYALDELDKEVA